MRIFRRLRRLVLNLVRKEAVERDLDAEIRAYVELVNEEKLRAGFDPCEARRQALLEVGGTEQLKERVRSERPGRWIEQAWQDLRFGCRMLRRHPGFAAAAVATLALGIGANTAIFSVVNGILLRGLPYKNPDRLVMLWGDNTVQEILRDPVSYPNFSDWRAQSGSIDGLAAITPSWSFTHTGAGEPEQIEGFFVSPGFFTTLGVKALKGRTFLPEDGEPGRERVVIAGYGFWQRVFGGNPGLVGRNVTIDGEPFTVIGILPRGFRFLEDADIWLPIAPGQISVSRFLDARYIRLFRVVGRLKPGLTQAAAQAELQTLAGSLERQYPDTNRGLGIRLVPLAEEFVGAVRPALLILFGAVGFVLLIACANVANLMLIRNAARRKEVAMRIALGAGRGRLLRQFLIESLILGLAGAGAGLWIAFWGRNALLALDPNLLPRKEAIVIDGHVLGFSLALALLTGVWFGMTSAFQASKCDPHDALKEGGRGSAAGSSRFRNTLMVAEIAVAFVLLAGAGLLIRSFRELLDVDPGFRIDNLLTMGVQLPASRYGEPQRRIAFWHELEDRIGSLQGVMSAGLVTRLPLRAPDNNITSVLTIEGRPVPEGSKPEVDFRRASPGYFRTLGIPLLQGRIFTDRDLSPESPVAMINVALARTFFPGENPLGRHIKLGTGVEDAPWITVVGVVGNVRHLGLDAAPQPEVYLHLMTSPPTGPIWAIRTASDPKGLIPAIRSQVRAMDPDLPVSGVATMEDLITRSVAERRFLMLLLGVFAAAAMLLAAVGIYGVTAYGVQQRRHEIAVRMAVGAQPGELKRLILGQGLALAAAGIAIGVAAAFVLTRLMSGLLYGITATDAATFAVIALLLMLVALVAAYVPARRAMRVDPIASLRLD
jgi:predicted permease